MRFIIHEPSDETIRRIADAWLLTWFQSAHFEPLDDDGLRFVTVWTDEAWPSSPASLKAWFEGLDKTALQDDGGPLPQPPGE